jgi:hypothetical protein
MRELSFKEFYFYILIFRLKKKLIQIEAVLPFFMPSWSYAAYSTGAPSFDTFSTSESN